MPLPGRIKEGSGHIDHVMRITGHGTELRATADAEGDIDWDVNVDSTSVRAQQHAAGAPRNPPPAPPGSSKGAPQRSVRMRAHIPLRLLLEEAVRQARPSAAPAAD